MSKLPREFMERLFFEYQMKDDSVIKGPEFGEDAAVLRIDDQYLVVHSDPISGAVEEIGWLTINIAANDIAVTGAKPRWALPSIQVPEGMSEEEIEKIVRDMRDASEVLDVDMIGGHTETVSGIDRPLITTTMMGVTDDPVFTSGSRPGDKIIQVKEAGIEGSWILAKDFKRELLESGVDEKIVEEVSNWIDDISVVKEALEIKEDVTSMHDPTEGGVLQGLYEMASCSSNDFIIDSEIPVREETKEICEKLDIDPLYLISSGCLLVTVPEEAEDIEYPVIGRVVDGDGKVSYKGRIIEEKTEDELFRIIRELKG